MVSSMICVSLAEPSVAACLAALKGLDFAEIRMDMMKLMLEEIPRLFPGNRVLIATCRPGGRSDEERKRLLMRAIASGATFVDVEIESETAYREEIVAEARSCGCRVIVSHHDYERTPERPVLEACVSACFEAGADIAKIACMVRSDRENARLLALLDTDREIVVVGMGERGRVTRILAPLLGSPFTYASLSQGKETADGQIDRETLQELLRTVTAKTG
jgi:3-dehydroquinate dehydratase I